MEDYIKAYYLSEEDTEAWIRQHKVMPSYCSPLSFGIASCI